MNQPLLQLRQLMEERGMDAYIIPACDYHQSEYFSDFFMTTRFLSGFTGEACTLVITRDQALLWTDGRFFTQAENQMYPEFTLMRMAVPGVPTVAEFLADFLPENGCLGFDGRVMSYGGSKMYRAALETKHIRFAWKEDLVDMVWKDRPAMVTTPAWDLDLRYAGESTASKLNRLRQVMAQTGADVHILAALDDIAWLFNLRAADIARTPLMISFALITMNKATLFAGENVIPQSLRDRLKGDGVDVSIYKDVYAAIAALPEGSIVMADTRKINMALAASLPESARLIHRLNPTTEFKAIKNEAEIRDTIHSHVLDGTALTRFIYWLKKNVAHQTITEIRASDYLEKLRYEQGAIDLSFDTIAAYGANAAMMHYTASPETDTLIRPEGFFLVDSGGHYMAGTTDTTRTIAVGPLTQEQKMHFTAVVRGMLNLRNAHFLEGCTGQNLDILARQPMWDMGIDYRSGTGHGVAHLSSVHEGPQGFRWQLRPGKDTPFAIVPGMITTDEPGIYLEGRYGIRIENELLCVVDTENEYGRFLKFKDLTVCPIDLDAIDPKYMTDAEVTWLNEYHKEVYETLKDRLSEEEAEWLKEATRAISK